jgi:hypothetical protein
MGIPVSGGVATFSAVGVAEVAGHERLGAMKKGRIGKEQP